ncbi:MAG: hydrogenase formation protein HypD [Desulfovibrionaceae bacterium]|nr:hydrogenase formation protein HypD [Desulfovibrionaceae bacterium]
MGNIPDLKRTLSNPELCGRLLERLHKLADRPFRFMEVCGTHTVALFRSGIASLLPRNITHLSGPGCPVCVTHDSEIALAVGLAGRENIHIATFGDLMRVPAPDGESLKKAKAAGARVDIVYSPLECLELAAADPGSELVFLGVGFETTSPAVGATVLEAERRGLKNFSVLCFHKLVPPALRTLLTAPPPAERGAESRNAEQGIDGFLLPGHVSTILGLDAYNFIAEEYDRPAVVAGFEPADLLQALVELLEMKKMGKPSVKNEYIRAVQRNGNPRARAVLNQVFTTCNARWRGLGEIAASGLCFRDEFAGYDAMRKLGLSLPDTRPIPGCMCGEALSGLIRPPQCPLFGKVCTPQNPVGPCMVSTEGSCAAYYNYGI